MFILAGFWILVLVHYWRELCCMSSISMIKVFNKVLIALISHFEEQVSPLQVAIAAF